MSKPRAADVYKRQVLGDLMLLSSGEQIPSDAEVMSGIAEANEAMLTGESDLVLKEVGDELLSGSYIASGQVYALSLIHI